MNSEILSLAKNKLKEFIKTKEVLDVILFGSAVKGKAAPNDIDVALITNSIINKNIEGFHISILKPEEFIVNPPSLVTALLKEGYSLKHNRPFAENYRFSNKVLFNYELAGLDASSKVRAVNMLRGIGKSKGLVEENKGEWLVNQVFIAPIESDSILERFFINQKIKFKKSYVLIH
ncbi:MAG: nucleotidyltransferase domain-containing protein [archaeon]|nr:nucleotidyltransferase domain-containing protein [archaeon]